jgi:DNA-binding CsgD family transcriptional regulator
LTVQQRQIAELAAVGLTNRQIGERLFLSHRTVGSHLHRLYPKLGITSRAALRATLEAMAPGPEARPHSRCSPPKTMAHEWAPGPCQAVALCHCAGPAVRYE